jgi:hypothetical protein
MHHWLASYETIPGEAVGRIGLGGKLQVKHTPMTKIVFTTPRAAVR